MSLTDALTHLVRQAGESAQGWLSAADVRAAFAQAYADMDAARELVKGTRLRGYLDGVQELGSERKIRMYLADGSPEADFVIQRLDGDIGTTLVRISRATGAVSVGPPSSADHAVRSVDLTTWYGQIMNEIAATVTETVYRPAWTPSWATVHNAVLVRSGGSVALTADVTAVSPVSGANILGDLPLGFRPDAESGMIQDQSAVETTGSKSAVVMVRGGSGAYVGLYRLGADWSSSRWRFRASWRTVDAQPSVQSAP